MAENAATASINTETTFSYVTNVLKVQGDITNWFFPKTVSQILYVLEGSSASSEFLNDTYDICVYLVYRQSPRYQSPFKKELRTPDKQTVLLGVLKDNTFAYKALDPA